MDKRNDLKKEILNLPEYHKNILKEILKDYQAEVVLGIRDTKSNKTQTLITIDRVLWGLRK